MVMMKLIPNDDATRNKTASNTDMRTNTDNTTNHVYYDHYYDAT